MGAPRASAREARTHPVEPAPEVPTPNREAERGIELRFGDRLVGDLARGDAHAASSARSAARSFALRARGFEAISAWDGCRGFFVRTDEAPVLPERPFHDPVLERVVREHDHAASGSEEVDRLRQGGGELLDLPVDRDAERLERPTRGVGAPRTSSHGAHDDAGQLVRAHDRRARARANDGRGDPARLGLLAVLEDQIGELLLRQLVDEVGGGRARRRPSACRAVRPPGS